MFLAKGNIIKRFKKISENNIKDGDKIQLQNFNEWNTNFHHWNLNKY